MKKVARLRVTQTETEAISNPSVHAVMEQISGPRTTGRIKKPKLVYDPSDNYLPKYRVHVTGSNSINSSTAAANVVPMADRKRLELQNERRSLPGCAKPAPVTSHVTASCDSNASSTSSNEPLCDVCQKKEAKRGSTAKNKLITCIDCKKKVHKFCLEVEFEDMDLLRQFFRCNECRVCDICAAFTDTESNAQGKQPTVTCSKCVKTYHLNCHIPNVHKFQQSHKNWKCNKCQDPIMNNGSAATKIDLKEIQSLVGNETKIVDMSALTPDEKSVAESKTDRDSVSSPISTDSCSPMILAALEAKALKRSSSDTPIINGGASGSVLTAESPQQNVEKIDNNKTNAEGSDKDESSADKKANTETSTSQAPQSINDVTDIPDVKDWSVDQVFEYFTEYFPREAHVFKEQEIDGQSLLLLKRSDVVKKLPFKLGPSLRIYNLILRIQTQLNDSTLAWN